MSFVVFLEKFHPIALRGTYFYLFDFLIFGKSNIDVIVLQYSPCVSNFAINGL